MVLIEGEAQVASHREIQEKEDGLGKEVSSRKGKRRRTRRSSQEGSGQSKERTGKRKRYQRVSNRGDGEHPLAEMAKVAPEEIPIRPIRLLNRKVRASADRAGPTKRPDVPTGQRETELEGIPKLEGPLRGGVR